VSARYEPPFPDGVNLRPVEWGELRKLQILIGQANAEKGFHDEGNQIHVLAGMLDGSSEPGGIFRPFVQLAYRLFPTLKRNYWTARLSLITTEVAEAIEELRNGRAVDETYYTGGTHLFVNEGEPYPDTNPVDSAGRLRKPEGVPSEVADVVIRAFDFAEEAGFDLASIIEEKLTYNASRPKMHGRKF
jgi:NTP pyrophosphatase (non-canonical NTP hydrolase)